MIRPLPPSGLVACALAVALTTAAAEPAPSPTLDSLRRDIWRSFDQVRQDQDRLPPARRITGAALRQAELAARTPLIRQLEALADGPSSNAVKLEALGLILEWGAPDAAGQALARLATAHGDEDATATVLQTAYGQSAAPDRRRQLKALAAPSPSDPAPRR